MSAGPKHAASRAAGGAAASGVLQRAKPLASVISSWFGEALLWLAAAGGAACIVLVVLAHTMGISLIMFSTGSMTPTIPAGSVALVQRVAASGIEVGDVVTVDREGQLPVTHRVTSMATGADPEERVITMRGDANERDDPHPYAVTSVRTVLASVPGLARVIVALSDPAVLGGLTIAAALLVGWAFWPRGDSWNAGAERRRRHGPRGGTASRRRGKHAAGPGARVRVALGVAVSPS